VDGPLLNSTKQHCASPGYWWASRSSCVWRKFKKPENNASNDLLLKCLAKAKRQILCHYCTSQADSDSVSIMQPCHCLECSV